MIVRGKWLNFPLTNLNAPFGGTPGVSAGQSLVWMDIWLDKEVGKVMWLFTHAFPSLSTLGVFGSRLPRWRCVHRKIHLHGYPSHKGDLLFVLFPFLSKYLLSRFLSRRA